MNMRILYPKSDDQGICRYGECRMDVADGITIQLCQKHLTTAYAAFLITNPEVVAHAGD